MEFADKLSADLRGSYSCCPPEPVFAGKTGTVIHLKLVHQGFRTAALDSDSQRRIQRANIHSVREPLRSLCRCERDVPIDGACSTALRSEQAGRFVRPSIDIDGTDVALGAAHREAFRRDGDCLKSLLFPP